MNQTQDLQTRDDPIGITDDTALSPTSKKVLEQCSVTVTAPPEEQIRTLISRPVNSDFDGTSGFHFARRNHAITSYSVRPQPTLPRGGDHPGGGCPSPAIGSYNPSSSLNQGTSQINPTSTTGSFQDITVEQCQPDHSLSPLTRQQPFLSITKPMQADNPALRASHLEPCTKSMTSKYHVTDDRSKDEAMNISQSHNTSLFSNDPTDLNGSRLSTDRQSNPDSRSVRSVSTSATISSKISKLPNPGAGNLVNKAIVNDANLPSQPSEEDLHYLLIHKLKRREQAEAETAALLEEVEEKLKVAYQENNTLKDQLKQVEVRCEVQETERSTQQDLIERWKIKFKKLRDFVVAIGNDHESLRKDGQLLKSLQALLARRNQKLLVELRQLNGKNDKMDRSLAEQHAQLISVRYECSAIGQSLQLSDKKFKDGEKYLAREQNRTAMLESFIRNQSSRSLKQIQILMKNHVETNTKLDTFCDQVNDIIMKAQSDMKAELQAPAQSCLELLRRIDAEGLNTQNLFSQIDTTIRRLFSELNTRNQQSTQKLDADVDAQTQQTLRTLNLVKDISTSLTASSETTRQLEKSKETNMLLDQKIKFLEGASLAANNANSALKQREIYLNEELMRSQGEVVLLKSQLADATNRVEDYNELIELRIKFSNTSAKLIDANHKLEANETNISRLEASLEERQHSLQEAEAKISSLEREKVKVGEDSTIVENRVRAEFTRASLLAKEQDRAQFEQQLHELRRERNTVKKNAETIQEQLVTLKSKLATVNATRSELEEIVAEIRPKLDNLEKEKQDLGIQLKQSLQDTAKSKAEMERALGEVERLKADLATSKSAAEQSYKVCILQEQFDLLRDESAEKDERIASMTATIDTLRDNFESARVAKADGLKAMEELEALQKTVEAMEKAKVELDERWKHRDDDVACLTAELERVKGDLETIPKFQQAVQNKDDELQLLQNQLLGVKETFTKVENILRQFNALNPEESLSQSCPSLEKRLACLIRRQDPNEMLLDADTDEIAGEMNTQNSKHLGKRKRTAFMTPKALKRVSPRGISQDWKMTEVVYHKESISRSISCSPRNPSFSLHSQSKKKQFNPMTSLIKPFSQIESNAGVQDASPTDLSKLLSTSEVQINGLPVPSTPEIKKDGPSTPSPKFLSRPVEVAGASQETMHPEVITGDDRQLQEKDNKSIEEPLLQDTKKNRTSPKGILKEAKLNSLPTNVAQGVCTPSKDEQRTCERSVLPRAPRRRSRTSSQYFSSTEDSSSVFLNTRRSWAVQKTTDTAAKYSRPRRYGKKKGMPPHIRNMNLGR
ncbi:hypothetical protein LOY97_004804 [Ophidiomyces ophidiicola]|nr:hypothetical protein LOZ49_000513 [Ophidiomyces ophidiicola]KAI2141796.1 hypothetical protein LOZ29_001668 [Ophidiomyces ophidiicola]KAI2143977.1 hypothetical protein LOZ28_001606 [Ophidiomyces ophidiicola]KAI2218723.1 hypothetical protein LOZ15_003077 [Ophidiomyces ophidiicola]KAI2354897.1 hypothetical protein LOY92_001320 [Ophidiomyces ophidiicola]